MPPVHYLKIYNSSGSSPIFVTSKGGGQDPTKGPFSNLVYTNVVNGFGICRFTLNGNHVALTNLTAMAIVEVWRAWPEQGIADYRDWSGFFLDESRSIDPTNGDLFNAVCYGDNYWLSTRAVAWSAGSTSRSTFSSAKGETIMKTLVNYNAAGSALASNGRDRDGAITGITVQSDGSGGNSTDWNCANENLLNTLQKLAPVAGGDFNLAKLTINTWQFNWYLGQLGTNRTASVKFSTALGNMANPKYQYVRNGEKTVALTKGQGIGADRAQVIRTGTNYNVSVANNEMYVNASSQATTTNALNASGDAALKASQAYQAISFDALPAANSVYGKDWFLGDIITATYKTITLTPKVVMVTVSLDEKHVETVTPGMAVNV